MKGKLGLGGILVYFFMQMFFSFIWIFLHARTRHSQPYFPSRWRKQSSSSL